MRGWSVLILPITIVYTYPQTTSMQCLWHNNACVEKCPEHMVVRESDCTMSYWEAQRTCENPDVTYVGTVCGFARCDCPESTVLDTDTGFCYDIDNCPTKHL